MAFWLSGKIVTTVIGALIGAGTSDWATANGFVTKTNAGVQQLYQNIVGNLVGFSTLPVWIFVVVVGLCCVPAFFEKREIRM